MSKPEAKQEKPKTPRNYAIAEIWAERDRQTKDPTSFERVKPGDNEGFSQKHDDTWNRGGQLAQVAALYALSAVYAPEQSILVRIYHAVWPSTWEKKWWKPEGKSRRRRLIVAGALIVAELERLARLGEIK